MASSSPTSTPTTAAACRKCSASGKRRFTSPSQLWARCSAFFPKPSESASTASNPFTPGSTFPSVTSTSTHLPSRTMPPIPSASPSVRTEGEADGIGGIVRDGKCVDVDVTDGKVLPGVNGFDAVEALSEGFGKNALHLAQSWLGDVKRRFPDAEHLRQAAAVVGVLVGDEDAIEMVEGSFDSGEPGQGFALA